MRINILLVIILFTAPLYGQEIKTIDASPLDLAVFRPNGAMQPPTARVLYSRPQKKGRNVFGDLVPFGKIWRTGANQSTEINLYKDFTFESHKISKGTYTLYTIPEDKEWTIIFNSKLHTWGHYDYDPSFDVLRFKVPVKNANQIREHFGIAFAGKNGSGRLLMAWDQTEVTINFTYQR